jgi:hypothetical protein
MSAALRALPAGVGVLTLLSVAVLLIGDASPQLLSARVHDILAALPLVLVAFAYMLLQGIRRARPTDWGKALIVSLAFLFWAANQISADRATATLFNDAAIALFVLDVFLVIIGWPSDPHRSAARESAVAAAGMAALEPGKSTR